jgi:predicted N-formylglutamate amidohydrolase
MSSFWDDRMKVIVTCEHGGNEVPPEFTYLFRGREKLLKSHRGFDPGARELAAVLAEGLRAPLYTSVVTRLLVDLNRSRGNPRLFSEISGKLDRRDKLSLIENYYRPYRQEVESRIARAVRSGDRLLHLSVHSFTPVFRGKVRDADIGLLYDPGRKAEREVSTSVQKAVSERATRLVVRRNYPYRGTSDGFTTFLRRKFSQRRYLGIEMEVNQTWHSGTAGHWAKFMSLILKALAEGICRDG